MKSLRRDIFLALANWLLRWPGHNFRRFIFARFIGNPIGDRSYIERGCRVSGRGGVSIGNGCNINRGTLLDGRGGLRIGNLVNISDDVLILTDEHDPDSPSFEDRPNSVEIGDRCWVATRAMILPGSDIGDGALIAASAVVSGVIPNDVIAAGIPARVVRNRDPHAQTSMPPYKRFLR